MTNVYLNTNILCRPFDDQRQERIKKEADAAKRIFLLAIDKIINIVISEIVLSEFELIENAVKHDEIYRLLERLPRAIVKIDTRAIKVADDCLSKKIIKDYMDILHLVCADISRVDFFITCDDELLQKRETIEEFFSNKFKIINPIDFVKEMEVKL